VEVNEGYSHLIVEGVEGQRLVSETRILSSNLVKISWGSAKESITQADLQRRDECHQVWASTLTVETQLNEASSFPSIVLVR
jgi:hypothetical protein